MSYGRVVSIIVLTSGLVGPAAAADWFTGSAGSGRPPAVHRPTTAIDVALTATTSGEQSATVIGTIAPFANLEESGLRLRAGASLGGFTYTQSVPVQRDVEGQQTSGNILGGYEYVGRNVKIAGFGGVEVRNTELKPDDLTNESRGMRVGIRAALDFYMQPTDYSMLSANFVYSTINGSYYGRIKGGIAIAQGLYVGPEYLMIGDQTSSQWRVGAHVTGLTLGTMQFGLSGGLVAQRDRAHGMYAILDARMVF
jgi:Cellulose biosynthesis protein BcsS